MLRELDLRQSRAGTQLLEPSPRPLAQFLGFRRLLGELDLSAHRPDPALPSGLLNYPTIVAQLRPQGEAAPPARGGMRRSRWRSLPGRPEVAPRAFSRASTLPLLRYCRLGWPERLLGAGLRRPSVRSRAHVRQRRKSVPVSRRSHATQHFACDATC